MRVEAWFAIAAAFSNVPPFFKYAVIPVARARHFANLPLGRPMDLIAIRTYPIDSADDDLDYTAQDLIR